MTGGEIRALRKKLGVTQLRLAELVGVAENSVARWERGEMRVRESAARLMQRLAAEHRPRSR